MTFSFDCQGVHIDSILCHFIRKVPLILFIFDSVFFIQVLIFSITLLSEILRVSGKNGLLQNQGFSNFDRMQFVSPSHMASSDITPNFTGWNSLSHEVSISVFVVFNVKFYATPLSPVPTFSCTPT